MKKILLLGAGYANIGLLKKINPFVFSQAQWHLVNNTPYHYKTIALHDVASGKHDRSVLFSIRDSIPAGVSISEDTITHIDGKAAYGKQTYEYDYLVIGLGFSSDNFGIKGVTEYTKSITSYDSAKIIAQDILARLQSYLQTRDKSDLAFVVCGGGFTGIEFVGSLAQEVNKKCEELGIDYNEVKIYCIEAMPKILPMFNDNLMQLGLERLRDLGVEVLTSSKILECKEGAVVIEQGNEKNEVRANTIIWTAGVKGNEVIANSTFFKSGRSKVEVNEHLQAIGQESDMSNIFIIGDCAALKDPSSGRFYPPTAQIAKKQGEYLAGILESILQSEASGNKVDVNSLPSFSFSPEGSICSIGGGYAIGVIGNKEIKGTAANIAKWLVESAWSYRLGGLSGVFKPD
ncbi:NAD(P)/FAD-dependent oxidoreductase [Helicobacter muridarum]|uniref:NADH:ubiquinone reductase (non-electrogenic) n=1 Tax=Helicobacter muridarum TaxID=216 RepID=A0A377PVN6_9HELI|nr:FAD-dependent oxidoreductase [Helicobacter muridarum]TLE00497.1 NAD(P)/FAD-dependent oxidoreductase [Helicobacter muridarum]STQ86472.1 pyridine nucleotide-disulphide oxidoreductase [Helicobacter muridarum]